MTTWILLRGLARETGHWGGFTEAFAEAFPDARVLPLELPGNGALFGQRSPVSIQALAAHCRAAAARAGAAPPYHLLALSLGGMVATAWAERHPEEIAGCVLVSTSFGSFSPLHQRLRLRAWPLLLRIAFQRSARAREHLVLELTSGRPEAHAPVLDAWTAIRRARPVSTANALRQLLAAACYRPPRAAPVATLVLAGAGDRLVDPRCSMAIARRWGCALALHPDAGHDLPRDDAAWVAREVRKGLPGSAGWPGPLS
jgi:pimeloyl-ACP methyl ester carboxylesterase